MKLKHGQLNKMILGLLKADNVWLSSEQIANSLGANLISVRCSMARFDRAKKVQVKKEVIPHEQGKGAHRLYTYSHIDHLINPMDVFLNSRVRSEDNDSIVFR